MSLFERLKQDSSDAWSLYTEHEFVSRLGDGTLRHECFKHYLKQDYLFLKHFARAYALAVYKSPDLAEMNRNLDVLYAILRTEMQLHIGLCGEWGIGKNDLESEPEAAQTMAYTRFVLEEGMRGDLLDLKVALSPCVIGYAEIGRSLMSLSYRPEQNEYNAWIAEYGGEDYQNLAESAKQELDSLAEQLMGASRYPSLLQTFKNATLLEADFWQMSLEFEAD